MKHPSCCFAAPHSLAFGRRGAHPAAWQSQFRGCPGMACSAAIRWVGSRQFHGAALWRIEMAGAPIPRPTKKPPRGGFWYRRRGEPARSDYFLAAASAAALAASAAALAASPAALAASAAAPATVPAAVPTAAPAAEAASVTAAAAGAGASAGAGAATGAGAGAGAGSSFLPQAARAAAATRAASTSDLFISDFLDGRTKHLGMPQRPIAQCCGRAAPQRFFTQTRIILSIRQYPQTLGTGSL